MAPTMRTRRAPGGSRVGRWCSTAPPTTDARPSPSSASSAGEGDAFDVIVESKAGRAMQGIDVSVTCDGRTARAGVHGRRRLQDRLHGGADAGAARPRHVWRGLQTIDVSGQAGTDKTYVFEFDPAISARSGLPRSGFAVEARHQPDRGLSPTLIRIPLSCLGMHSDPFASRGPGQPLRAALGRDDSYPCSASHMARSRSAVQMRGVSMPCASS